ncbi:MAG: DegT/DnrJ/EryC1/StrS family aminotransferase, partial [Nitrospirota bacterium]|nr:DegT/DnrJ/EryC1/StrS family aminotransferase [Nitrospirota bacterium]
KYMPFNLQAALGYAQFQRINELVGRKRELFRMYKERLSDIGDLQFNTEPEGGVNGVWTTAVVFGKSHGVTKKEVMKRMNDMGIPSRPFFYPLSSLPAYPGYREKCESLNPVAYDISNRGINLSCAMNLTEDQIDAQCNAIRKILGR